MAEFESRAFSGATDLIHLIDFVRAQMIGRWPASTYWHPGDIVWQLYPYSKLERVGDVRLWSDAGGLAGFAIFEPPLNLRFDIRRDLSLDPALLADVLAWGEARWRRHATPAAEIPIAYAALEHRLATVSLESDTPRAAALREHGFRPLEQGALLYRRSLGPVPELVEGPAERAPRVRAPALPGLPPGFRVRHATDADIEERAALHRDAWSVWGPSSFTAERYRQLRAAPLYDETLDIVVEAPNGALASSCIAWADDASGIATFEPVGTRPAFAGLGLGRAATLEAFRRLSARGIHTALVSTASVNAAGMRFYPSCGFEQVDAERFFVKEVAVE